MRRTLCVLGMLTLASAAAQAQQVCIGAGGGATWEWQSRFNEDSKFTHHSGASPAVFLGFPLDEDTLFRLRAAELERPVLFVGLPLKGSIRAYTAGIDYFLPGVFGRAAFSAGLGAYQQVLDKKGYDELTRTKFGWYVGVGEWFELTRRLELTAEVLLHRTENVEKPSIVTATVGLAFWF